MTVPTPDELYDFIERLVQSAAGDGHAVFDEERLITAAFRHFKSTSNAIRPRLKTLHEDGRLVGVRISNAGYAHPDHEELRVGFTLYFSYVHREHYNGGGWGRITHKRPQDHENPWANGFRNLYTTRPHYDAMIAEFLKAKEEKVAADREKERKDREQTEEALNRVVPDATALLSALGKAVPGIKERSWSQEARGEERVHVTLELWGTELPAFLDIIRRGLPDVPRETKES
jgi:hypothetical protein